MPHFTWKQCDKETFEQRKKRAGEILRRLKKRFPGAKIALNFGNNIQLLVAVILSAQCTDKKVNEVTAALFKKYKSVDDFEKTNLKIFEQEIRSTGFYRAKAKNIINAAKMIKEKFDGRLPRTMEEMTQLPGVARKTANIVLGNAYRLVEGIAVDTHVRRVSQRLGLTWTDEPVKIEQDLMRLYPKSEWLRLPYYIIDHGRAICDAKKPKCGVCLLNDICPSSWA